MLRDWLLRQDFKNVHLSITNLVGHGVGIRGIPDDGGVRGSGRGDGDDRGGRGPGLTSPPLEGVLLEAGVGDPPAYDGVSQGLAHRSAARVVIQLLQHGEVAMLHLPEEFVS